MRGPEGFITKLGLEFPGIVLPDQRAVLDAVHRTTVNGHFFWASNADRVAQFREVPYRFTGPLLDPVNHTWFSPSAESPRRDTPDGILIFESAETAETFDKWQRPFEGHGH